LDFSNSFKSLNNNGTIVLHDANPPNERVQRVPRVGGQWTGDGWKTIYKLRLRSDLKIFTVDTDFGCCVVRRGYQKPLSLSSDNMNWKYFESHKYEILNLISTQEFNKWSSK